MLQTVQLGLSPVVTLFVTSSNAASERRFDKALTIQSLKERLEPITGVPAATMKLKLQTETGELVAALDDDSKMLGFYAVQDFQYLHVIDTSPFKMQNNYTDVSKVEKFEMAEDDYDRMRGTVRDFKRRHKIGRFADAASESSSAVEARDNEFEAEAAAVHVGDRCLVEVEGGMSKRGAVRFVGKTDFKPGYWVGVEYDEPVGRNNGTVNGRKYFEARPNHGAFVRPNKLQVGDFPEEDLFDDEDEF
ncbi:hypothetical protein HK105_202258 [Polyrhizophydium stewartii]|uniref:CAP-Gly domain-containing protein n=1 Tax=Polyrhizophydium stewartii TaxID=2732419 RepID=A0ABR4NFV3_9FUNG|nr:hypothetical protein HK105_006287 [Polyrhizophydium stewartii]